MPKIAITHDWLTNWGGGESVLAELMALFPNADVYTAIHNPSAVPQLPRARIHESWVGALPNARTTWQWYMMLLPLGFLTLNLKDYDIVLASSFYAAHHLRAKNIICYKHSPARAAWSNTDYLKRHPSFPSILKPLALPQLLLYRKLDRFFSSDKRCTMVSNSSYTANWCKRVYHRSDVRVVYPPVDVARFQRVFHRRLARVDCTSPRYWVYWGRHVPQKRLDIAIEACALTGEQLILIGEGVETPRLKRLAARLNADVLFPGRVCDAELDELLMLAKGLIFPAEEDFGITPVEACAAGLKLIAYGRGGVCDWITPDVGQTFYPQTAEACVSAMRQSDERPYDYSQAAGLVRQFSPERFRAAMTELVMRKS